MNKFARMIDVLDLFSESDTLLSAEEIAARLQIYRPTAFRYVRELCRVGFLANYSGRYSLGARIITLDYRIRESDPLLKASTEVMRRLAAETACSAILCRIYNDEVINMHHEAGGYALSGVGFGRGRPMPLFRGSVSKVMLAFMPAARLRKVYERHRDHPDLLAIAADWPSFKAYFSRIRQVGHYLSCEELDAGTCGLAAPIDVPGVGTIAAISLVFSAQRQALINIDGLAALLKPRTVEIANRLAELAGAAPADETPDRQ